MYNKFSLEKLHLKLLIPFFMRKYMSKTSAKETKLKSGAIRAYNTRKLDFGKLAKISYHGQNLIL